MAKRLLGNGSHLIEQWCASSHGSENAKRYPLLINGLLEYADDYLLYKVIDTAG